ncbi:MAG TPA: TetR/AcrR family transcriptional regulator [Rhizomicrobium sp.]|nr:TetR/AcrR family transcriptional regulator [Rhizomicrobium sp.]
MSVPGRKSQHNKTGGIQIVSSLDEARSRRKKPDSLGKLKAAARKLFVERGYHATRPQDIAREADVGHGTFYLHFPDKRACFLDFVDDARRELDDYIGERVSPEKPMDQLIALTLNAIFDYAETHPGVLNAAMTDEAIIDAEGVQAKPLLQRWGEAWAAAVEAHGAGGEYDTAIVGQAIIGAIHQVTAEAGREGRKRQDVIDNLSKFLIRALKV